MQRQSRGRGQLCVYKTSSQSTETCCPSQKGNRVPIEHLIKGWKSRPITKRRDKKKRKGCRSSVDGVGVGGEGESPRPRTDVDTEGSASQMPSLPQSAYVLSECPLVKSFGLTISRFWNKVKCTIILGSCGTMINAQLPQHTVSTHVPTGNQTHALPVATMTCGRQHPEHLQQERQAFVSTFSNLPRSLCNRRCLFYG